MKVIYSENSGIYTIYGNYEPLSHLFGTLERLNIKPEWLDDKTITIDTEQNLEKFLSSYCQLMYERLDFYHD
ncbi:hypothetical protein [Nostoc phage N1]|nr:hypothetical protein [Nostoc phage N1]